ncbi:hypothetical protein PVK06_043540 [Gossypium arboreum]|uniref:RNase H type-1 domain-containing protein n=1 Tax=Gossypium arboreum TaxID=29729 RepID=A0ABR0MP51_GOSAR|nr:hypothetical protein PVK06_043540 [Gossypium arboreum]
MVNLDTLLLHRVGSEAFAPLFWKAPTDLWVRPNFDAALFINLQAASAGVVVRNNEGLLSRSTCFWKEQIPCPLSAEALAFAQAIRFARDLGFRWVETEGNSAVLL